MKAKYAAHIKILCERNKISVMRARSSGGKAFRRDRSIAIREVKSAITYAEALHEIGHILGSDQSKPRLFAEAGAWKWAKENCLKWTDTMERKMRACLKSYLDWAGRKRIRKVFYGLKYNPPVIPSKDHYFWELLGPIL